MKHRLKTIENSKVKIAAALKLFRLLTLMTAMVCLYLPWLKVHARDEFTSDYSQTEFTEEDGFESGQANCICQSSSGYVWIGTDSGLYRYDGSLFRLYSLDTQTDGSMYKINCILVSENGNLYVGTENYGLYVYNNGRFGRIQVAYQEGISTVNDMYEDAAGAIWLATSQGVYVYDENEIQEIQDERIMQNDISALSGFGNVVYAIVNSEAMIRIRDMKVEAYQEKEKYTNEDLCSLYVDEQGIRYYGTIGHSVLKIENNNPVEILNTGSLNSINKIFSDGTRVWVLTDDGVGYFNAKNKIVPLRGLLFSESMKDMMVDFEGNYWFTSYRKGLLFLERSKFQNISLKYGIGETIVNCVIVYNNKTYIGTDDGLVVINEDGNVDKKSELVEMLDGKSIRELYVDSSNQLWICTYRVYGVVCVNRNGKINYYSRGTSNLVSNSVNCIKELSNGSMAIGTENGISILRDGEVVKSYTRYDGMENADIITLCEDEDGILYAGSNGAGMYSIDLNSGYDLISVEEGIDSNFVTTIVRGSTGLWIGTDNGLYYREGVIRHISAVDSSTSISDIILDKDGYLWIFGSKGIQKYYENDLLSNPEPSFESFTKNNGLVSKITEGGSNYITEDGRIYICCNEGLYRLDQNNIYTNQVPPKVRISSVTVNDKEYSFSDLKDTIQVSSDTNRIIVKFSVLSYVNRGDIRVSYYLDGFDDKERELSGKDVLEAEYTNLEGGRYTFVLSASNSDGVESEKAVSFTIEKELNFWETGLSKAMITAIVILLLITLFVVGRIVARIIVHKNQQMEELKKQNTETEKLNRAKNDYVNYLNHEIRTPLNSILAVSEMLIRNAEVGNSEMADQYSSIYGSGYEILRIVDGISRLSNLQDGNIEVAEKEYAVSDIIDELSNQFKSMINREVVQLKVSIEDNIPNGLIGDAAKVKEIITNIYNRAAKTTKEGSISIGIDWRKCGEEDADGEPCHEIYLDFIVADTGVGVKEERIDSFFYLDDTYDKNDIGNFDISVGVAVAYQLIRLMDGEAEVSSTYGAGTTVKFSIRQAVFDYSYVNYNANHKKQTAFRNSNSRIWLPDVRLLLVDDSEVSCMAEKALFDTYELLCDTAGSGFEAIDKVMVNKYDIVFVNTVMPVMDGRDTVREIRGLDGEDYKKLPIVGMSVNLVDNTKEDILNDGFDRILVKPLMMDEIETVFNSLLPEDKIKAKTNDIRKYIKESRYKDDVSLLKGSINVEAALKIVGGKFDVLNRLIAAFKQDYEKEVSMLDIYIEEDVRKYRNIIHDIRNNSGNIGAFSIERKAENLESAINIGNMQYARDNTGEFVMMLNDLFRNIERYINKIHPEEAPKKIMKDSVDRALLKEIRGCLKNAEKKKADRLLEEIKQYEYGENDTEFLKALFMTMEDMDYKGASEIIDQYLNSV